MIYPSKMTCCGRQVLGLW